MRLWMKVILWQWELQHKLCICQRYCIWHHWWWRQNGPLMEKAGFTNWDFPEWLLTMPLHWIDTCYIPFKLDEFNRMTKHVCFFFFKKWEYNSKFLSSGVSATVDTVIGKSMCVYWVRLSSVLFYCSWHAIKRTNRKIAGACEISTSA